MIERLQTGLRTICSRRRDGMYLPDFGCSGDESSMYHNSIVQENLQKLKRHGYEIIAPVCGMLANGDTGDGKLPSEEALTEYVIRELAFDKDMKGLKVLVTAGPTQEALDPVPFYYQSFNGKNGIRDCENGYCCAERT